MAVRSIATDQSRFLEWSEIAWNLFLTFYMDTIMTVTKWGHTVSVIFQGSLLGDCQAALFCAPCAICQMWRELDAVGWHA